MRRLNRMAEIAGPILAFVLAFVIPGVTVTGKDLPAIPSDPCDIPEARQFDFWIGHWDIEQRILQADGTWLRLPATTHVSRDLEGCALVEHWKGKVQFFWEGMKDPKAMSGLSVRAYDPESKQWGIYWIDTLHTKFGAFEGQFKDGAGTFLKSTTGSDGKPLLTRITFSDITENSVTWTLAISRDDGQKWQTIWIMKMKRKRAKNDADLGKSN